jgi:predicted ATPase/DNA-binding SARP family transcriptional activator
MEFRILGPLEVAEGDRQRQLGGTRERALLAILLIHAGEVVSADRLIEELWGGDLPGNPANALQVVVSRVRKALEDPAGPGRIVTRKPGYALQVRPEELDAGRFGRLVAQAQRASPTDQARALALLEEALGLWRGPAYAEFAVEGFAREEITRLEEERIRAVEMKAEAELALGRHARIVGELGALVAGNPLRERLRGLLMLALYRSGRQGEALRVFQEGRSVLVDELGVDPGPELRELHQQILLQAASLMVAPEAGAGPEAGAVPPYSPAPQYSPAPPGSTAPPGTTVPPGNFPAPVTSFVGRQAELAEAGKMVRRSRLVTLTGPGGSGKTRLAVELARAALESFPDGAWLVELEAVSDPAAVPAALAAALGIGESASLGGAGEVSRSLTDKLVDYLRGKQALVVLDNCEHLVEACARVAERVLRSAPRARFLATSRERLGVGGEALLAVPPLGLPEPQADLGQIARAEAVQLFVERATDVRPAFALDLGTGPAVGHICRRLDGIPLAIELAAARVRILPAAQIAARLEDRFGLLTSGNRGVLPRHQTLRAAIDWSYELLAGPERELFGRLSVFAGGFSLEAAEEVCGDGGAEPAAVLESLSRLVDQSLVIAPGSGFADDGRARFRMLETLRRYAGERLAESGMAEKLARRHAEYFARLAEQAEPLLRGPQQGAWLRALEADRDNLGAAMDWAFRGDPDVAVRLTSALAYFWLIGRRHSQVRQRLADAVGKAGGASPANRARALTWAALLADVEGRADDAVTQAREAYALSTDAGDPWWLALCEAVFGLALGLGGEIGQAGALLEAGRARFWAAGDGWGAAIAAMLSGYVTVYTADAERAMALARESLDGFRAAGDQWGQTMALELAGLLARRSGAFAGAIGAYEEALGIVRDLGLRDEVPFLLVDLGDLHVQLGDFEMAAVLHKEALDLAQDLGARDAAALARSGLAMAARRQGDYERARELHRLALAFYREAARTAEMAYSLAYLGYVEELRGDLEAAAACHRESLRVTQDRADAGSAALALEGLACVAAARRDPRRTAALLGAAESLRGRTGMPLLPAERVDVDRAASAAVDALGAAAFDDLVEQGRQMSLPDAAAFAAGGSTAG